MSELSSKKVPTKKKSCLKLTSTDTSKEIFMKRYVLGMDFGTLSGRALVVDALTGEALGESVFEYPHGVMDVSLPDGTPLRSKSALQHPEDYIFTMQNIIDGACRQAGISARDIEGVGVDFTGCTVLPIDREGQPMCFYEKYKSDPNAYVKLWKDHASTAEADRITKVAQERGEKWLDVYSGKISSEWMLPKILQTLETSPELYSDTYRFIEAGDWINLLLTGNETHARSFAGLKAIWNSQDGYPEDSFFKAINKDLSGIVGTKLSEDILPVGDIAGYVSETGEKLTGLRQGTPVALAMIDAWAAMPALGITDEGQLMLILGTSGCFIVNSRERHDVKGICGHVYEGAFSKCYTYEAGQSCLGDGFDWYVKNFVPESYALEARREGINIHKYLGKKAKQLGIGESGLVVLDWFNGNRSILADYELSGMILGLTLATKPEEIYRAIIEAAAFSSRMIIDAFTDGGVRVDTIMASGGIALKDEMMMQIYADVTRREIRVASTTQAGALGSAIYAAVAGGIYNDLESAVRVMSVPIAKTYSPIPENSVAYDKLFEEYKTLHDYFGRGGNDVMKRLGKS